MPAVLRGIRFVGRDIFVSKDNNQSNRYLNLQKILSLLSLLLLGRNKLITHATNASPREDFQAQNGSVGKDFLQHKRMALNLPEDHQAPLCNQAKHLTRHLYNGCGWSSVKNEYGSIAREKLKAK